MARKGLDESDLSSVLRCVILLWPSCSPEHQISALANVSSAVGNCRVKHTYLNWHRFAITVAKFTIVRFCICRTLLLVLLYPWISISLVFEANWPKWWSPTNPAPLPQLGAGVGGRLLQSPVTWWSPGVAQPWLRYLIHDSKLPAWSGLQFKGQFDRL